MANYKKNMTDAERKAYLKSLKPNPSAAKKFKMRIGQESRLLKEKNNKKPKLIYKPYSF
mgnify:CR=1 FL=1